MLRVKVHRAYRKIVAISDSELLGKKFVENNMQLDINKEFYGGDELEEEKALEIIKIEDADDATFNIVGEKSIQAAVKAGIIKDEKGSILKIQGIPHALGLF
ncbi:DUF424 family protein [Nanoarchaeota archaeon]